MATAADAIVEEAVTAEPTDIAPPAERVLGPVTQKRDLKTILEKRNAKKRKKFPKKVELNASDSDFE